MDRRNLVRGMAATFLGAPLLYAWTRAENSEAVETGGLVLRRLEQESEIRVVEATAATSPSSPSLMPTPATQAAAPIRLAANAPAAPVWGKQLLAGGIARGVSVGTCFPLDSLKTRSQIQKKPSLEGEERE
eukprot:CAMPEP_0181296138 /NCGR_PEP_ID=MMETSP1101-20121128/4534_1 /TAXON_ID=46948 /ORGANISM="Rhodomonas abbreviata, Strain Caron Lab Isolate" /LENGTH=130 /DNA_ID=CAMNT_0023400963 /DNA_START=333 /DNA_END=722 /DNA_ORIENTATION=-